ncbi:MAG: glycosyltransferase, partial [Candidatus Hodarchaeota archaeon]
MRILIIALSNSRLLDYLELRNVLKDLKVATLILEESKYCMYSHLPKSLNNILIKNPNLKFPKLIKQFNPNFILVNSPNNKTLLAKMFNRPLFVHLRGDPWLEHGWNKIYFPSLSSRIYTSYLDSHYISILKSTDFIFANSKWLQKRVEKYMPNHPVSVLYTGINPDKWIMNYKTQALSLKHPAVIGIFNFNMYLKTLGFIKFLKVVKKLPNI